jgi:hypothetical protein
MALEELLFVGHLSGRRGGMNSPPKKKREHAAACSNFNEALGMLR